MGSTGFLGAAYAGKAYSLLQPLAAVYVAVDVCLFFMKFFIEGVSWQRQI
jgi:hypothetical protein